MGNFALAFKISSLYLFFDMSIKPRSKHLP
nr:MAG TPA: hypothetical protein [Caudoviricetes sp.]